MSNYKILMYVSIYLLSINLYAFILMWSDKRSAESSSWRISEKQLILAGILGGVSGAMAGMLVFRHKTKRKKFYIGLPLIFLMECLLIVAGAIYMVNWT